jgi:outer membrane protein TolC
MKLEVVMLIAAALYAGPVAAQGVDTLPLSLETAVERALTVGDEVLLARAQVELADAQLTTARASALPQLRLSGAYTHVLENARAQAVGQIFNQPNTYTTNANLSHAIFQGGRALSGMRAASQLRRAARLTADEARNNASFDVQNAYLQALFAQQLIGIQEANLQLADAQLKQVMQFESSGRAARYDVLRARVQRANIEPQLIEARSTYDIAVLELKRLANIAPAQAVRLTTRIDPQTVETLVTMVSDQQGAIENRPSLRAAELTAQARHAAIGVARADFLPTVSVFFQSGFQAFPRDGFPSVRGQLVDIECPPETTGRVCTQQNGGWFSDRSLGVQFSWPLFDGLRAKGNIDAAQAQAKIADRLLAQEREDVALEIERARAVFARAQSLFAAQQQNAAEANEAFRLASLRFTRGLSTQLDVSDAQIALLTARTNEARAVYDLYLATADLARAQGKPIPLPQPAVSVPTRTPEPNDQ